jgi:AcrR family transcriptional regulator
LNRKQLQSEVMKSRLLETAFTLFSQKGFHAASIEEIAAAAGTSKANIYYHFKSKEALFIALLDQYEAEWKKLWEEQRNRFDTVAELLYGFIDDCLTRGCHHPLGRAAREFMNDEWGKSEEGKRLIALKVEEHRRFLDAIIQPGIESGEFKPGNGAARYGRILESLFRGLGETTMDLDPEETAALYRSALDIFLHGIKQDK